MEKVLLSDIDIVPSKYITIFKKNNIETVEDFLLNYPNRFDDYTIVDINDVVPNEQVTISGIVQTKATVINTKTKLSIMNFYIDCGSERIRVTIFNRHFLKSKINYGVYVRLTGKLKDDCKNFIASEIHFDEFSNSINPVFNIKGISDDKILELKERLFYRYSSIIDEILPNEVLKEYDLISKKDALKYINIPDSIDETRKAIKRIKFEELLLYQLKIKYLLYMRKNNPMGVSINYNKDLVNEFINSLPFKLTCDQVKAVDEILFDMNNKYKMNRLLQGEVGSGKTVVAAISLFAALTDGYQGAIMVPTEILARQHFDTFTNLFKNTYLNGKKVNVSLLVSSIKNRKEVLDGLNNGDINIVIGTHALFQHDVVFKKLGLVVTDEEHRFGVKQRVGIVGKGYLIDHLKMSATPIPRTLAISVLGESDISILKALPGNKKEPITKYYTYSDKEIVYEKAISELDKGHQVYVICPMIEKSEAMDLKNATQIYEQLNNKYGSKYNIGLIHSCLKQEEKEEVMNKFIKNEINVLVSTSVIEVGVNVINATMVVILDADRFGIAQLHQMRGRVRRSDEQSYCYLVSDTKTQSSIDRLKLVEANSDGFVLAEEDLIVRGPGDFFGEKQSGNVEFKLADIVLDKDLFNLANDFASKLIESKKLFSDDYKKVLDIVHTNYIEKKEMLD